MKVFLIKITASKQFKTISSILLLAVIGLFIVWGRAFYGSMKAYQEGETYLKEKQYVRAVTFFDRSIHWYTPFNPYVRRSVESLWAIGEQAEKEGDIRLALIAYRTIRSGFYGASHFRTPGMPWIEKSEEKIDALIGEDRRVPSEDSVSLKEALLREQKTTSPVIFWTIVLEIGFLGWVGSVTGFIVFRLKHKKVGEYGALSGFFWLVLTVCFFALWIVGMMRA